MSVEAGQSRLLNIPVRPERTGTIRVLVNAVSSYGDHTVTKAVTVTVSFSRAQIKLTKSNYLIKLNI